MIITWFLFFTFVFAIWLCIIWSSNGALNAFLKTVFIFQAIAAFLLIMYINAPVFTAVLPAAHLF